MSMLAERTQAVTVTKLHPMIGAEIGGVDLSRPLDKDTLRQVMDAWHEHSVLLFRDQNLSEDDQRRFASYFGPVAKRVPPKPGAPGAAGSPEWDDMMMISDKVDSKRQAARLARPRRNVVPHRQVLPPPSRIGRPSCTASTFRPRAATHSLPACTRPTKTCRPI